MNQREPNTPDTDLEAMAAYYVVRLSAEDCTPEDRFAFDRWKREDPSHEAAYHRIKAGNDYLDRFMDAPAFQARIELARQRTRPSFLARRSTWWGGAAVAASLVALVSLAMLPTTLDDAGTPPDAPVLAQAVELYETRVGERSTVTLSDGSVVTINTDSQIEVGYTDAVREITLVRGQAFFDVAPDLDRPFVVLAADQRVMALGTAFDVRLQINDTVQVTLVEGVVQVERSDPLAVELGLDGSVSPPAEESAIALQPGERLTLPTDQAAEIIETDGIEETSWRRGQLVFRDRALGDVVAEMNRYSVQQLRLAEDERVQSVLVSGVFNSGGPPSAFVDALEALYPLQGRRTSSNEITLVWRD